MRLISLLLLVSVAIGCGVGGSKPGPDPRPGFGTSFPAIASLAPNTSPVNSAPFTMTIQGSNFGSDAIAFWNGNVQQTTFISSSELLVTVNAADLMFTGLAHIFIRSGGMNTNTVEFNVTPQ
jgi:IPT/TIG domain